MIENVNNLEELRHIVNTDHRVIILDFFAPWCTPCLMLTPLLIDLEKFFKNKVLVIKIDIDRYPRLADAFNITSVPTIAFFFNRILWKELTITGADIGTTYENVNILLTEHNDGFLPIPRALLFNPKTDLSQ